MIKKTIAEKICDKIDKRRVNDMFYVPSLYEEAERRAVKTHAYAHLGSYADAYVFIDGSVLQSRYNFEHYAEGESVFVSEKDWEKTIYPEDRARWGLPPL